MRSGHDSERGTADPDAYRDEPDRVLHVLGRLLDLAGAIVWPHSAMRAKFFANRDRVRHFRAAWNIPEVVWTADSLTTPTAFLWSGGANRVLRDHTPYNGSSSASPG